MIRRSNDGKVRILSLSYGKDSLACLGAIEQLGLPLDAIVHAEVWATDDIPADLPPMVDFKKKADRIIEERYGLKVEHCCAYRKINGGKSEKYTYEKGFYRIKNQRSYRCGTITGFPFTLCGAWCNAELKIAAINKALKSLRPCAQYLGIAADEPERIKRHSVPGKILPLVEIGWDEAYCRQWCEENDLLSPIYTTVTRGGCWFCNNQGVDQLRLLRKNYPYLWNLLLKWDNDSPVSFKSDGHTVNDFEKRFSMEDEGFFICDNFKWAKLEEAQMNLFQFLDGSK